ncbi:MAG: L,D-transpeptidase family protein, partial [Polyangiales bacterium]
ARAKPVHVVDFQTCALSGGPGPKTREGDGQVPEGLYEIDRLHPGSHYHLALHVNYPNTQDRKLGRTGSAIMIHGDAVSIGCIALGDLGIERLWAAVAARPPGTPRVQLHSFPQRGAAALAAQRDDAVGRFWHQLGRIERDFPEYGLAAAGR